MTWSQAGNISTLLTEVGSFGGDVQGTTRDDLTVSGIQGTQVDADNLERGRSYVYNGTEFVAVSAPYRVISDGGQQVISTTSPTTLLDGSPYTIPAGSLAVGDTFEVIAFGSGVNSSGSARTFTIATRFDSTAVAAITTDTIASGSLIGWEYQCRIRVNTIGGSASIDLSSKLWVVDTLFSTTIGQSHQAGGVAIAIGNSTTDLDLNVFCTLSASSANLSITADSVYATYCRNNN